MGVECHPCPAPLPSNTEPPERVQSHLPLSPNILPKERRDSFCHKGGVICISEVIDISPGNLDSRLRFIQRGIYMMYFTYKLNKRGDNIQP